MNHVECTLDRLRRPPGCLMAFLRRLHDRRAAFITGAGTVSARNIRSVQAQFFLRPSTVTSALRIKRISSDYHQGSPPRSWSRAALTYDVHVEALMQRTTSQVCNAVSRVVDDINLDNLRAKELSSACKGTSSLLIEPGEAMEKPAEVDFGLYMTDAYSHSTNISPSIQSRVLLFALWDPLSSVRASSHTRTRAHAARHDTHTPS